MAASASASLPEGPSGNALVQQLFDLGSEANVDYKTAMPFPSGRERAKLAKHIMGMANRRDGGFLLIGVHDTKRTPESLTAEQLTSWDLTRVGSGIAAFMAPAATLDIQQGRLNSGEVLLAIRVAPFNEQPLVCTHTTTDDRGRFITREGALYIRTSNAETREIADETSMRELLERAYVKKADQLLAKIKELIDAHLPARDDSATLQLIQRIDADLAEMQLPK